MPKIRSRARWLSQARRTIGNCHFAPAFCRAAFLQFDYIAITRHFWFYPETLLDRGSSGWRRGCSPWVKKIFGRQGTIGASQFKRSDWPACALNPPRL